MTIGKDDPGREALDRLLRKPLPDARDELRQALRRSDQYAHALQSIYLQNPFFQLTDDEAMTLREALGAAGPLGSLVAARHAAMRPGPGRYLICCMPKSASSFLKLALEYALELPPVSLTSFGNTWLSSQFGMNPREQELDELALVKAALLYPQGFVAQHHTRYTTYLGLQMRAYGLTPIVTVRNIADALVSFDDMMMDGRAPHDVRAWVGDSPFALPAGYASLDAAARYRIIGASLGVWLIQFHLSWLRAERQGFIRPLFIRYRTDILDPERLTTRLAEAFALDARQRGRLREFADHPDPARSRFNVGRAGRGREAIPGDVRDSLLAYARAFEDEISAPDLAWLLD